jgi:hypothetical protein
LRFIVRELEQFILNNIMEFVKLVCQVLQENSVAGGTGSVFGAAVSQTATANSGDNLAKDDGRNIWGGVFPGILTRRGLTKKSKKKSKKRKS